MFPNAKTVEYFGIWDEDKEEAPWKENFTKDIRIIRTPGHSIDSLSLLVNTKNGVVAICGDVFWKEYSPENDTYATTPAELKKSRELILKNSDFVIPGHGKMFAVRK